jgi:thiaminase
MLNEQKIIENIITTESNMTVVQKETIQHQDIDALASAGWIFNHGNHDIQNALLIKNAQGEIVAFSNAYPAQRCAWASLEEKEKMKNCWFLDSLWISPDTNLSTVLPFALYTTVKRGYVFGKEIVLTFKKQDDNFPMMTYLRADRIRDVSTKEILVGQSINYSLLGLYDGCTQENKEIIVKSFIPFLYDMFFEWYKDFNQGPWCSAIRNGKLTKRQYISTLYNLHAYVQHTTRLCARAVAHSSDLELRNNYIEHFKGEINHEVLIQKDLMSLGEDMDYLKKQHLPNLETKAFMVLQESTIGFYQDPVMFLACPFVAEGISANFADELLEGLEKCIQKWDIKNPEHAMRFLNSHVKFDGGDEGHWKAVIDIVPQYMKNEHDMQKFIATAQFAMHAMTSGFNSNVLKNLVW